MPAVVRLIGTVPSNGIPLYRAECDEHPRFRRVPWTTPVVPTESCDDHNNHYHAD